MNILQTNNDGGMKLESNDIRWIVDGIKEALKGLASAMTGGVGAKLQGCEVVDSEQGDVFTCTEGFVYFNDEIYFVEAHNIVHSAGVLFFKEVVTYDAAGQEVFDDLTTHDTYEIRRATLESAASQPANTLLYNADYASTKIGEQINLLTAWVAVAHTSLSVSATGGDVSTISGYVNYKKVGKTMTCVVNLTCDLDSPQVAGSKIKIQIPATGTAKTDKATSVSIIVNTSANGDRLNKMSAVGGYLEIIDLEEAGLVVGNGYNFTGEITFEIN